MKIENFIKIEKNLFSFTADFNPYQNIRTKVVKLFVSVLVRKKICFDDFFVKIYFKIFDGKFSCDNNYNNFNVQLSV